ncbi:MAG TPA: hypothetical protein VGL70_22280 [Candidatus Binatia bacterium]|jgi:photosystem II stability/assembly factor-like uncharacterized protein
MAERRKKTRGVQVSGVSRAKKLRLKRRKQKVESGRFRVTTHKARSEWFRNRTAWPLRDAPVQQLVEQRRRAMSTLASHPAASQWTPVGPSNIGGRMTCVASDPENADMIWAGAAGGGVWQSRDAGKTWTPLWHQQESLNIGVLAIDSKNHSVLYCGTGEANLSADSYPGVGLYKTTDGGATWQLIAPANSTGLPPRIGAIAIDPFDSNHVLVGGVGHHYPNEHLLGGRGGLYESFDAGRTWKRLDFISVSEYRCHAIVFHPAEQGTLYVTVTEQGSKNGIWKSTNGGKDWVHLTNGLPPPELFNRTSLAIAPSKPSILYALAADSHAKVLGVFRSDDGGSKWKGIHGKYFHYKRQIGTEASDYEVQMSYNNTIAVHPQDPNHVLCGGVDLHLTKNGGKTWRLVTRWEQDRGQPGYAHADHHALLMPAQKPGRVYDMNDGGMDVSEDGGQTWSNRSNGLAATMFYDLDVAQTNDQYFGGGVQDNGSPITINGAADQFFDVTGGDGGFLVFDPKDENHIYASVYNLTLVRFPSASGKWEEVSPPATKEERDAVWMAYIAMDPSNSKRVFTASQRVWRTDNDGNSWSAVSDFFHDVISAIEVAPADPKRIYVGTESGEIHRSLDRGNTWSDDLSSATLPKFKITRLITSPVNADHVIATVANFGRPHVYRSLDGAVTWADVDRGRLPDVPHNSLAIPEKFPAEVYVATDVGVFFSPDFGETWQNLTGNLPHVSVVDLVYHSATDSLSAASYGRSIWRLKIQR